MRSKFASKFESLLDSFEFLRNYLLYRYVNTLVDFIFDSYRRVFTYLDLSRFRSGLGGSYRSIDKCLHICLSLVPRNSLKEIYDDIISLKQRFDVSTKMILLNIADITDDIRH